MQNYKKYAIPPAQLIIADVPYNVGTNFYGSNPMWYNGSDNKNGESKLAGKAAFNSDFNFNLYEYFHFCSKMLKKEDKNSVTRGRSSNSPCMIVFCSFEQMPTPPISMDLSITYRWYLLKITVRRCLRQICVWLVLLNMLLCSTVTSCRSSGTVQRLTRTERRSVALGK